jgi:uncharacterized membrane protein
MLEFKPIAVISFLILLFDGIVLSLLSKLWKKTIENVQQKRFIPNFYYAFFSYVLIIFGQYHFVHKHIKRSNWVYDSIFNGFLFGFVLYGVFDFTNLAIFTDYSLNTAIIDMIWGGTLLSVVSFIGYYLLEIRNL